jgi:hypothetical protein
MGSKKRQSKKYEKKYDTLLADVGTIPSVESERTGIDLRELYSGLEKNSNIIANNKRAARLIDNISDVTTKGGINYKKVGKFE